MRICILVLSCVSEVVGLEIKSWLRSRIRRHPVREVELQAELRANDDAHARDLERSLERWDTVSSTFSVEPKTQRRTLWCRSVGKKQRVEVVESMVPRDACRAMIDEAESYWVEGEGENSEFTMTDALRDVHTDRLPAAAAYLRSHLLPQVYALIGDLYEEKAELRLYDTLLIRYDAALGVASQPVHRDYSMYSFNLALNDATEYEGGGTSFEDPLSGSHSLFLRSAGDVALHPSGLRHAGAPTTKGRRYVLVGFISGSTLATPEEHARLFHMRALQARTKGDDPTRALSICQAGMRLTPREPELHAQAALALSAMHDRGQRTAPDRLLLRHARTAARLMPRSIAARNQLGLSVLRARETLRGAKEALRAFEDARALLLRGRDVSDLPPDDVRPLEMLNENTNLAKSFIQDYSPQSTSASSSDSSCSSSTETAAA